VSTPEATGVAITCALCEQRCTEVDGGRGWFHLEVTREEPVDDLHWWEVDFCSQAHAAEWFSRPLPSPSSGSGDVSETTWSDRLAMAGCFAVFVLLAVLSVVGTWTAGRFVAGLF
jgi:hypothetical protein